MVKIPELTIDDVFTGLELRSPVPMPQAMGREVLVPPERVRALYPGKDGCTSLDLGTEEDGPTVEGTPREVALKLVATMNRRRQREAEATDALDKALLDDEIDKIVDEQERRPSRRRRSRSTE